MDQAAGDPTRCPCGDRLREADRPSGVCAACRGLDVYEGDLQAIIDFFGPVTVFYTDPDGEVRVEDRE